MTNQEILEILKQRFEKNKYRHPNLLWNDIESKLIKQPRKIDSLILMEETNGEPDVIEYDEISSEYTFMDCSKESPKGRRSLCYDQLALEQRKKFPPQDSAMHMASIMGIDMLNEDEYRMLQKFGPFDTTTSSWIITPKKIRNLNGALFCDYRYDTVFVYHNGADSYYGSRGFRGKLVVT